MYSFSVSNEAWRERSGKMLKAAVLARGLSSFTTKDFVKLFQKEEANAEREKESKYRIRNTDV